MLLPAGDLAFLPLFFLVALLLPLPLLLLLLPQPVDPLPGVAAVNAAKSSTRALSSRSRKAAEAALPAPLNSASGRKPVAGSTLPLFDILGGCRPPLNVAVLASLELTADLPATVSAVAGGLPAVAAVEGGGGESGASPNRPPVHTNLPSAPRFSTIVDDDEEEEDEDLLCDDSGDCNGGAGLPLLLPRPELSCRLLALVGCLATAPRPKRCTKEAQFKVLSAHRQCILTDYLIARHVFYTRKRTLSLTADSSEYCSFGKPIDMCPRYA